MLVKTALESRGLFAAHRSLPLELARTAGQAGILREASRAYKLAEYLTTLTYQQYQIRCFYSPSIIACAAVFLALGTIGVRPSSMGVLSHGRITECIKALHSVHQNAPTARLGRSGVDAVMRHFSRAANLELAKYEPCTYSALLTWLSEVEQRAGSK